MSRAVEHVPLYSEIDVNGHVNNARYADWLCNCLGVERLRRFEIWTASIEYRHEI
ncbi:MAG: hypothetical protein II671_06505, partial [Salinivirgaceae bacterium]|nr:hypothetical protein [Salinivirgaceae bacterium]